VDGDTTSKNEEAGYQLTQAFADAPAAEWVGRLRDAGLLVEPVPAMDRDTFRQAILDDPVNRQLGRAIGYQTPEGGYFEQLGPLLRCGPATGSGPVPRLPGIGEHTVEILRECGRTDDQIEALLGSKFAVQLSDQPPPFGPSSPSARWGASSAR
jgi:crotonobetainyl-CoA:carnitine CoA-transferase CaiB-like acyl-CoA transferase